MKTKRSVKLGLLAGALTGVAVAAMPGCELLVDFDRSKIPMIDASMPDVGVSPSDGASPFEASATEAGLEAGPGTTDAGLDAMTDAADAAAMSADASDAAKSSDASDSGSALDAGDAGAPADSGAAADAPGETGSASDDASPDSGDGG